LARKDFLHGQCVLGGESHRVDFDRHDQVHVEWRLAKVLDDRGLRDFVTRRQKIGERFVVVDFVE